MTIMYITPVASSTLATIAYDASEQILQLEFRDRSVYRYLGVPAEVHQALLNAPSKGQFFNRAIRGIFRHELAPAKGRSLS
jgi:KTSC domain